MHRCYFKTLKESQKAAVSPQRRPNEQHDARGKIQDGGHRRLADQRLGEQRHRKHDQGHH